MLYVLRLTILGWSISTIYFICRKRKMNLKKM